MNTSRPAVHPSAPRRSVPLEGAAPTTPHAVARRVLIHASPFSPSTASAHASGWKPAAGWPSRWILPPTDVQPPFACAFRRRFALTDQRDVRVHVSADERYELYLDGERIGRGPERSDAAHWCFESYDLTLPPGDHVIVARVWVLGDLRPWAQVTVQPGFLLTPDDHADLTLLGTGVAEWDVTAPLPGYAFLPAEDALSDGVGTGPGLHIDAATRCWNVEHGTGLPWAAALHGPPGQSAPSLNPWTAIHQLRPAWLPPLSEPRITTATVRLVMNPTTADPPLTHSADRPDEHAPWSALLHQGQALTIGPHACRRVVIDLTDYYCHYPTIVTSGGAGSRVSVRYAEAGRSDDLLKGRRDDLEGKRLVGPTDTFLPDGAPHRTFEPHWWRPGRYVQLDVQTHTEPLTIDHLHFHETRYPLDTQGHCRPEPVELRALLRLALRTQQVCTHDTYLDCPGYEQLMYVGDTRIQALNTYVLTDDDQLPRKALTLLAASMHNPSGFLAAAHPAAATSILPPFSLWWIAALHDHALWRGDATFTRHLLPTARALLDRFLSTQDARGLIINPPGWNFYDWTDWTFGVPPDAGDATNALLNWHVVQALKQTADLEAFVDEPELAARWRRLAKRQAHATHMAFWSDTHGLYADDTHHRFFSEHTQCLALLSHHLPKHAQRQLRRTLFTASPLTTTSSYFSHYLFDAAFHLNRPDVFFTRLEPWLDCTQAGFTTLPETFDRPRSDCHAWSAHPLYHFSASILGVKPNAMGFGSVRIAPQLGPLTTLSGTVPHPAGPLTADFTLHGGVLTGTVQLPPSLHGQLNYNGVTLPLHPGVQDVSLNAP